VSQETDPGESTRRVPVGNPPLRDALHPLRSRPHARFYGRKREHERSPISARRCLAVASEPEVTRAFDPFVIVGVCPIESGLRPWTVVFHSFGDDMPEEVQVASGRVFKHLAGVEGCLTKMIELDPEAREAAYALEVASDPETLRRSDVAIRAVWSRYGVDTAVREVAQMGHPGPAVQRLLTTCETLRIQADR